MRGLLENLGRSACCGALVLCGTLLSACGSEIDVSDDADDFEGEALLEEESETYPRYVQARGAFTCDLILTGDYPVSQVPPDLERDRMVMTRQRGVLVKYLPLAFDSTTTPGGQPNLQSGGRYLFRNARQAENYHDFVADEFTLDGVQFFDREIFLSSDCHHYRVVRAYEFTPLHDTHVMIRVERFAMAGDRPVRELRRLWPDLQQEAGERGMAAVWLIHNVDEGIAAVVYLHDRVAPNDPTGPDFGSLLYLASAPPLGHFIEELGWERTFDRTHWILTIWHPFVDGDHGEPSDWPHSPPFGLPSCGDDVCEVSRGEDASTCSVDCPAQCGDANCQPSGGENDHNCPGDCGG